MPRGVDRYDEALIQGRLWTPQSIPATTLSAWYDASQINTLTIGASNKVTNWADRSGNGRNLAQANSAKQPTYNTVGFNKRLPGVVFDGSDGIRGAFGATATVWNGFVVFQINTNVQFGRLLGLARSDGADYLGGNGYGLLITDDTSGALGIYSYDSLKLSSLNWVTGVYTDPHLAVCVNSGSQNTVGLDGTMGTSASYSPASKTPDYVELGATVDGTTTPLNGVIVEAMVLAGALTTRERQMIEGYLAWHWRHTAWSGTRLSASHPFGNRPPLIGD